MGRYTREEIEQLIANSAREQNILAITSKCDSRCIFCSHQNNPPQVRVVSIGSRSLEEIRATLPLLRADREITIGESASCIIEGEPTMHPQFREILALVRRTFPDTPISITTNGRYLSEDLVAFLASHQPVLINLSLNSASPEGRRILMGDTPEQAAAAIQGVRLLHKYGVPFTGSMVGMPNKVGYDDIAATIRHLAENGARSVSIFTPAFSSRAPEGLFPDGERIHQELKQFLHALTADLPCPVLLEPSFVTDLRAVVSGVSRPSPAWSAGVRRDDVLLKINGQRPRSRVDAYNLINQSREVTAVAERDGQRHTFRWTNGSQGSGITMEYDFDPARAEYIKKTIHTAPGFALALCSEFAHGVFQAAMAEAGTDSSRYAAVAVKNRTFGGTVRCAGLLTIDDYLAAWEDYCAGHPRPGALLIPMESFNSLGMDLTGRHVREIGRITGCPVALV